MPASRLRAARRGRQQRRIRDVVILGRRLVVGVVSFWRLLVSVVGFWRLLVSVVGFWRLLVSVVVSFVSVVVSHDFVDEDTVGGVNRATADAVVDDRLGVGRALAEVGRLGGEATVAVDFDVRVVDEARLAWLVRDSEVTVGAGCNVGRTGDLEVVAGFDLDEFVLIEVVEDSLRVLE